MKEFPFNPQPASSDDLGRFSITRSPGMPDQQQPLLSTFASDPDMHDLIEMFVTDLQDRIDDIRKAEENRDANLLAALFHQLKGAGGGYGFPDISRQAAELENALRATQDIARLTTQLNEFRTLCSRVSV